MKIAVCIFGQPRFYKEAAESFRNEFLDMPEHDVDVFMHCWDNIGYIPADDKNSTNEHIEPEALKTDLWNLYGGPTGHIKGIVIESPEENFYELADSLAGVIFNIRDDRLEEEGDWRSIMGKKPLKNTKKEYITKGVVKIGSGKILRYETGQFYSIGKCIQLKAYHELQNDFEYDLVIRVRTDSFYPQKELYRGDEERYYQHKELYYSCLHKRLGGVGIVGHGLKIVCGIGNGDHLPGGDRDQGWFTDLEHIEFKDGRVVDVQSVAYDSTPEIFDNITDDNGMFAFPWKVHLKDWILCADTKTADRVWGGMLSVYTTYVMNDLVRFMGNRQIGFMPGGEVVNGFAGLLNDGRLHQVPDWDEWDERYESTNLHSNKRRAMKMVHPDTNKRKQPFVGKRGEGNLDVIYGGGCMPAGSHKDMTDRLIRYAASTFDPHNALPRIYRNEI